MDPDDVIKEAGAEGLELLLAEAFTLLEFLWLYERNAEAFGTPEEKVGLKARMLRHIDTIQDPDIRRLYRDEIYEKFGDATRKSRREKREHSPEDPHYLAQKKKLKFIYTSEPEVSKKYFHNRLGCAIARSFVLWPDFLPIHAEKLALVKDVDSRIDAMLDALPEGSNLNTADIQLLIHRKGLDQPHPNEFGDLHFPFAHPFFETSRARECLDEAVTLYSDVQRARQSLKAAQARYENDLSKEYEEEKLRLQKVVRSLENKEKKMAKEYAFAN
jgi:DNA primase